MDGSFAGINDFFFKDTSGTPARHFCNSYAPVKARVCPAGDQMREVWARATWKEEEKERMEGGKNGEKGGREGRVCRGKADLA